MTVILQPTRDHRIAAFGGCLEKVQRSIELVKA